MHSFNGVIIYNLSSLCKLYVKRNIRASTVAMNMPSVSAPMIAPMIVPITIKPMGLLSVISSYPTLKAPTKAIMMKAFARRIGDMLIGSF